MALPNYGKNEGLCGQVSSAGLVPQRGGRPLMARGLRDAPMRRATSPSERIWKTGDTDRRFQPSRVTGSSPFFISRFHADLKAILPCLLRNFYRTFFAVSMRYRRLFSSRSKKSNRRSHLPDYASWAIHPVMKQG